MNNVKEEFWRFGETTSIRGVPKIFKSKDPFLRNVWLFFVVACASILLFLLITLFGKFFTWPYTTQFGEETDGTNLFPDVTICSLNEFAYGSGGLVSFEEFFDIVKDLKVQVAELNRSSQIKEKYMTMFDVINTAPGYIVSLPKTFNKSNDCPMFVANCMLYSDDWIFTNYCSENFREIWHPEYYLCSTIKISQLGSDTIGGLTLVLNIGAPVSDSVPFKPSLTSTDADGVRIAIHPPGTLPDFKRGVTVGPGTENLIKVAQRNVERLDKPYNPFGCKKQKPTSDDEMDIYPKGLCVEFCQQHEIYNKCSCVVHWYAIPKSLAHASICGNLTKSIINGSTWSYVEASSCVNSVTSSNKVCDDKCLFPCHEIEYSVSTASASWPPQSMQLDIYQDFFENCIESFPSVKKRYAAYDYMSKIFENKTTKNTKGLKYTMADLTQIQESITFVKIVMEIDYPYTTINKPLYSWDVMVSLVGGMLSLWLGINAMTVAELLEMFYFIFKKRFETNKK